ncbi:hypothetical protein [Streptomyces omiyaensis]
MFQYEAARGGDGLSAVAGGDEAAVLEAVVEFEAAIEHGEDVEMTVGGW